MCTIQSHADKDKQGSWFQVSIGFMQEYVNAPIFFARILDSICRYIEAKANELGFVLAYSVNGPLLAKRQEALLNLLVCRQHSYL